MPIPVHSLQPSFTAGELSPSLLGRTDFNKYSSGLKTGRNGWVHPQGGFSNRPGFLFVALTKNTTGGCRLIPFEFSATQAYMLEFGEQYVRFYKNGGAVLGGSGTYEIQTPYKAEEVFDLKVVQSADTLYIAHPLHPPQVLVRHADADWTIADFPFEQGPFMLMNTDSSKVMSIGFSSLTGGSLTSNFDIFNQNYMGVWFKVELNSAGQSTSIQLANGQASSGIFAYKQWKLLTGGTWFGTISVQAQISGSWVTLATFHSANDANFNTFGDLPYPYPVFVRVSASLGGQTTGPVTITLTGDSYIFTYSCKITNFSDSRNATISVPSYFAGAYGSASSANWSEGSWSRARGFPAVCTFYQDRLCWASSPSEPEAIWASQTGDYVNYGISDPLVDSDAISFNIPSRKLNTVQNLVALTKMLPLTMSCEVSVGPGATGVLSPTSIDVRIQGYRGCSKVNVAVIGNMAIYVQPMGSIVRSIGYQFINDSFTGDNLSLLSNHLFFNHQIMDMAYQQEPDSLIWAVRDDGKMLTMTFLPEQQVIAWTWHDTQGTFESVATMPVNGYNEVWAVVTRPNGRFIERLAKRLPTDAVEDQMHLDCSISYDGSPTTIISGLGHLEGVSVTVLGDGNVMGPYTVASGQITLEVAVSKAHIGRPYVTDFETLNFEMQSQDGSAQGRKQRAAQAIFRFLQSVGGKIGPDFDHLRPILQRSTQPLGSPIQLSTYDHRQPMDPTWKNNGRVCYRQDQPLPVTILMVVPIVEVSNL